MFLWLIDGVVLAADVQHWAKIKTIIQRCINDLEA